MCRVRNEAYFLPGGIDEGKTTLWTQHRQRQSGESCPGPDIRDRSPVQISVNREAVEKVVGHHVLTFGDCSEVVGAVPFLELVEKLQQARGIGLCQLDAHTLCVVGETMNGVQRVLRGVLQPNGGLLPYLEIKRLSN